MSDAAQQELEKRVGTTLCGKWTLERLLGAGGMAAVYVGVHKIGRRDAIKILHPEIARQRDLRQRFEQEAHAVNRFTHPGAVEIRDIDAAEDGAPFLVMELLEGESLSEVARKDGGIETGELLRLVDELLDVLAAAHAQGIIHRDIKLDNLFVQKDGRLKVLDFGIARMREGAPRTMHTRTGATLGTLPYMPPEQVKGLAIDGRADLFAVGATLFRVIAKRRIHDAVNDSDMLVKMATQPAPSFSQAAPAAPRELGMVVDRALAFHRERRYPDATTMQADVRALRRGEAPPYATARLAEGDVPSSLALPASIPTAASFAGALASPPNSAALPVAGLGGVHRSAGPDDPTRAPAHRGVGTEATLPPALSTERAAPIVARDAPTITAAPRVSAGAAAVATEAFRDAPTRTTSPTGAAVSMGSADAGAAIAMTQPPASSGGAARANAPAREEPSSNRVMAIAAIAGVLLVALVGVTVGLRLRDGSSSEETRSAAPAESNEPSAESRVPDTTDGVPSTTDEVPSATGAVAAVPPATTGTPTASPPSGKVQENKKPAKENKSNKNKNKNTKNNSSKIR